MYIIHRPESHKRVRKSQRDEYTMDDIGMWYLMLWEAGSRQADAQEGYTYMGEAASWAGSLRPGISHHELTWPGPGIYAVKGRTLQVWLTRMEELTRKRTLLKMLIRVMVIEWCWKRNNENSNSRKKPVEGYNYSSISFNQWYDDWLGRVK